VRRDRAGGAVLTRDAVAIAAAMIAVGGSLGAITISYGLPVWVPFLMSSVVFAGGAQFLAVGLFAAGNPIAAVLAGLLLNARHPDKALAPVRRRPDHRPLSRTSRPGSASPATPPSWLWL